MKIDRCVFACLIAACAVNAGSIDFESPLPGGLVPNSSYIAGSPVDAAAQLTNQYESLGVIFATLGGGSHATIIALGAGHAVSGVNGIGPVSAAETLDYTLTLDITFVVPGTLIPAVTDLVSIAGDEIAIPGTVYYSAYDVNGNLLASGNSPDTGGGIYQLAAAGIHEFRIYSSSGTVAYDNLNFGVPVASDSPIPPGPSTVPEPATSALTVVTLLGVGWRHRAGLRKDIC